MAELRQAFLSLPPITRSLLALTAGVTIPPLLGLVKPYSIVFYWPAIRHKYEIWRFISPFFYAGSGISALFNVFFLFRTSRDLEEGVYRGRTADLAWALTVMGSSIIALNYPLKSMIFFRALLLALTHLWAQFSPEQPMNLYGFITIPAKYLSYSLLLLDLLQGGVPVVMEGLTGIISAHLYHYLTEVYPLANPTSRRILDTPNWFRKLLGEVTARSGSATGGNAPGRRERSVGGVTRIEPVRRAPAAAAAAAAPGTASTTASSGRSWGSGRRLGD